MKKEVKVLLSKSIDSLFLSIEHFNRPWDRGRPEAVLILLDRSFELLFKSIIVHRGGKIRERRAKETLGFDLCVRKCLSDVKVKCLSEEEAMTVQIVNSLRDAAQHYLLELSEQQLYIYTQGGLTLYLLCCRESSIRNSRPIFLIEFFQSRQIPQGIWLKLLERSSKISKACLHQVHANSLMRLRDYELFKLLKNH